SVTQRIDYDRIAPDAVRAVAALTRNTDTVEPSLRHLVELRASQINGCAFCIDLHSRQARQAGEGQQRLDCLGAWRETPLYSDRERAALAWTEALTLVADSRVPDDIYRSAREHFGDRELVELTMV